MMTTAPIECPSCGSRNKRTRFRYVICQKCGHTIDLKVLIPVIHSKRTKVRSFLRAVGERLRILTLSFSVIGTLTALAMISVIFTVEESTVDANAPATAAALIGLSSLLLVAVGRKTEAILVAACCGGILVAKPLMFPIWAIQDGARYPVALTSAIHLNFLVPGVTLMGSAFIFMVVVGTLKRRSVL